MPRPHDSCVGCVRGAAGQRQTPKLKDVKIRGYVTEFRSPTDFDIEDYRARLKTYET